MELIVYKFELIAENQNGEYRKMFLEVKDSMVQDKKTADEFLQGMMSVYKIPGVTVSGRFEEVRDE